MCGVLFYVVVRCVFRVVDGCLLRACLLFVVCCVRLLMFMYVCWLVCVIWCCSL